ncbi:hypothetical protein LINPERPRIM_LOCUS4045, partial [Linum perenne]
MSTTAFAGWTFFTWEGLDRCLIRAISPVPCTHRRPGHTSHDFGYVQVGRVTCVTR